MHDTGPVEDRDLATLGDTNHLAAFRLLASSSEGGEVIEGHGMVITLTGAPTGTFNVVFLTGGPDAEAHGALLEAMRTLERRHLPYTLRVRQGAVAGAEQAAEALGFRLVDSLPSMALAPIPGTRALPRGLEVRAVRTAAEIADAVVICAEGFELSRDLAGRLLPAPALESGRAEAFVGYLNGRPAATSMLVRTGRAAGIYNVATVPAARGRGIGSAMTAVALTRGREAGASVGVLQASIQGLGMYDRMGFRTVGTYLVLARTK